MSKYCEKCGNMLKDDAAFCGKCGAPQELKKPRFCTYCGKEMEANAVVCTSCGAELPKPQPAPQYQHQVSYQGNTSQQNQSVVEIYAQRVQINAIIWIAIGALQVFLGLLLIDSGMWYLMLIGVLNLLLGIKDMQYAKTIPGNPAGIINKVQPLVGPIITLVYNLIFGGVIGVGGSIYYLIGVRGYALSNTNAFLNIEKEFLAGKYTDLT